MRMRSGPFQGRLCVMALNQPHDIDVELLLREGDRYLERRAFSKAVEAYQRAAVLKPEEAVIHFRLGMAFAQMGHYVQAVSFYREVIRLRPDHTAAHTNLGFVYYEMGFDAEAK